ncbi:hypothetical protein CCR78_04700 [Rhodovulum imhoffii]|uniref:hypothetical protein n=1 Tax=Rhodovulum imhoffii TaxID=365340 RepID=UPI000D362321|nr:hypothetical protein [Rhodovulum imhoffii]
MAVLIDPVEPKDGPWAVSDRLKRDLAIRALRMAITLCQPPPGCDRHTDRGSQYFSHFYQ